MRIDLPSGSLTAPARALASAQGWLLGQLLNVSVIGRVDRSSIRVSIDGIEAVAKTDLDLAPGATLKVRVSALGQQPQLTLVDPAPQKAAPGGAPSPVVQALKLTLPAQEPMDEVLNRISPPLADVASAPAVVQQVQVRIARLLALLPGLSTLASPEGLRRAFLLSGPQLEASLAAQADVPDAAQPAQDLKFQLLALRQSLDEQLRQTGSRRSAEVAASLPRMPPPAAADSQHAADSSHEEPYVAVLRGMAADVEAGLARITTHQLQHAAAMERGEFFLFTEIPFQLENGIHTLDIELEADAYRHGDADDKPLELSLALSLPSLGEFRARIGLLGNHLAVSLWSEAPALREMIVSGVSELEHALMGAGFEISPVSLHAIDAPNPLRHLRSGLVDTSA
jgi:hypothetical protein